MLLEKLDDYTVKITFKEPSAVFLSIVGYSMFAPKHYLKQFHPRYVPMPKLEKMAKDAGLRNWYDLYADKAGDNRLIWGLDNPDFPVIGPWKAVNSSASMRFIMERNPYYWKVDAEGNQLPYIDRVVLDLVQNQDIVNFKAMAGEVDMQFRHISRDNYTLLMKNRKEGNYRVLMWPTQCGADPLIIPNLNCKDRTLRRLIQDDRFRKALSLAINREEINGFIFNGLGEPRQASFVSGTPYFSGEWEKAYAEYDPERANAFLDEMGLTERDKEGFRLRPDSKTLSLTIELPYVTGHIVDTAFLVKDYWEAIGIKTIAKAQQRALFTVRRNSNQQEVQFWGMDTGGHLLARPDPVIIGGEYGRWYHTGGKVGEKPTGDIARLYQLWDKIIETVDEQERHRLIGQIIELHIKNIWIIGTIGELPVVVIVKNNFRNVPQEGEANVVMQSPKNACPEQFFIRQE